MPTIKISDLSPTGSELFHDSESYMNELGDSELDIINGASLGGILIKVSKAVSGAVVQSAGRITPKTPNYDPGLSPRTPASFTFF